MRAVDISEWTGPVDTAWWQGLRADHNVEAAIIQCWGSGGVPGRRNEYLRQHVQGALGAGLKVATYCWPPSEWSSAIAWIGDLKRHLAFFALDVEMNAGITPAQVMGIRDAGLRPVIYASPSSWSSIMGNTNEYADLPLWLARYQWAVPPGESYYRVRWDVALEDVLGGYQVGGWNIADILGWQFTGTVSLPPETADLNVFRDDAFDKEDDEMTEQQIQKLNEAHALAKANEKRIVTLENKVHFHQAVLEIFRNRLAFNDELTVRLWAEVFSGEEPPDDPSGSWVERIAVLEAKLQAIAEAAGDEDEQ